VVQCVGYGVLILLTESSSAGVLLVLLALSVGFFGHAYSLVSYMVSATSGLPDDEQGLATGLTTMSMQIAITLGIPVISAVIAARDSALDDRSPAGAMLGGVHAGVLALSGFLLLSALLVWLRLGRDRAEAGAR
jgi:hypothetical protein